jgi:hypothetical protein
MMTQMQLTVVMILTMTEMVAKKIPAMILILMTSEAI